jgi:PAS domain S-box-containing protein
MEHSDSTSDKRRRFSFSISPTSNTRTTFDLAIKILLTALIYFAAGQLGLAVPFTSSNVSPVWPAFGVAVAAVMLWGYEMLAGVALAAFLVNFANSIPLLSALGIAAGSSASACLAAYLLRRANVDPSFSKLRDVWWFVLASLASPLLAALAGATSMFLSYKTPWTGFLPAFRVWWAGDVAGIWITIPLFFTYRELKSALKSSRRFELLGLSVVLIATCFGIFWRTGLSRHDDVLAFVVFPFVFWAAIRFRAAGAALMTLLVVAIALASTAEGSGPFARNNPLHNVTLLQVFIAVLSITGLTLGAFITERKRIEDRLLEQALLLDLASDAILVRAVDDRITYWNQGAERLYGWARQEVLGRQIYEILETKYQIELAEIKDSVLRRGNWTGEIIQSTRDGRRITVESRWSAWRNRRGQVLGFLELNTDITERKRSEESLQTLTGRLLKVQDEERRRIARELHDSLGQYLTATKIELDMLAKSGQPIKAEDLLEPASLVQQAISETRTLSHLLHPPLLDEAGFASAARWYVEGFCKRSGVAATLAIPQNLPRLAKNVEIALFRILQESLINVHRHSGTRSANIHLSMKDSELILAVRDYGQGIPDHMLRRFNESGTEAGVGLAGIRERAKELGGTFHIDSGTEGTTITVTVPVEAQNGARVDESSQHAADEDSPADDESDSQELASASG